jgi:putative thymidine phosphorylase
MDNKSVALETIKKKLLGKELSYKEIFTLMDEISHGRMGDILTTYFVAAGFKEGFTDEELFFVTKAMIKTGTELHFDGIIADKHSIGGVAGTRTTMIVVPIVATAGFKIPKTSSRAITSPAGTADVMETIAPVVFEAKKIESIVNKTGGCIIWGGHLGIAPADDIMIRVEEPLSFESFDKVIVSIMAKKVAAGTNHLVLDIPVGPTMKIKHFKDATAVCDKFKMICDRFKIKVAFNIENTNQPEGTGVGPALEARDVFKVLEQTPDRSVALEERAIKLAGTLLDLCYETAGIEKDGFEESEKILRSGQAKDKFYEIVKAQGGDVSLNSKNIIDESKIKKHIIRSDKNGEIFKVNNFNLNAIAKILGAPKDKYAGIDFKKRIGQKVKKNEELCIFYASDKAELAEGVESLKGLPIFEIK